MASNDSLHFFVWERLNKRGKWCPYDSKVSEYLEVCYKKSLESVSLGDVDSNLQIYVANLKSMVQVSNKTGTKSKIRRKPCTNTGGLGIVWQWNGNDKDVWQSYDVDVNDFIESSFQKGEQKITLKKTFHEYNYEIDFTKMLQINLQTKRKRAIRRQQIASAPPAEQCSDDETVVIAEAKNNINTEYPGLSKEVPGTSELVEQLKSYLSSVSSSGHHGIDENSFISQTPTFTKNDHTISQNSMETSLNRTESINNGSKYNEKAVTTHAIVNGMPWYAAWPPHTPSSLIKPVPGISPLPKFRKKKTKKMKVEVENHPEIFDLYTEEIANELERENILSETCIICCETLSKESTYNNEESIVKMKLCSHVFHKGCLEAMYNSGPKDKSLQCPTCKKIHGVKFGIQPPGDMIYHVLPYSLPGFPDCDTIRIIYDISSGIQGPEHPRPGKKYTARGFPRHCYLPDNEKGRKVLRLLVKAWKQRLIFTIGRSSTTGEENTVTWNEIHHKTEFGCNRRGHGFPDPNYFDNVLAELEAHGVKDEVFLWYPA